MISKMVSRSYSAKLRKLSRPLLKYKQELNFYKDDNAYLYGTFAARFFVFFGTIDILSTSMLTSSALPLFIGLPVYSMCFLLSRKYSSSVS